ncbi:MAG TPA: anthranilate phosphoribosyltransferase [Pyrinomonadaceae bacterium]|nr:anthranilate phosphoribosyltransferase [Pyrinomonadaceae bacterium]
MTSILREQTNNFSAGRDLDGAGAGEFLDALIGATNEDSIAAVLRAWDQKGIAEEEIFSFARILRDRCIKVASKHETFADVVGTGGSTAKTFNVSTAAAFVTAGAGVPVAKHGNRAATSNSGSADVLDELGVEPAVDAATAERCLNEIGVCFMFAPNFHRLSPTLGKVRRGLGFPTIFNCVGPLCNPASAPHQVIGVWDESMVVKMANALARLGTTRSWVVHGGDGLDEISLGGTTTVAEVDGRSVYCFEIEPGDFGLERANLDDIRAGSSAESAGIIRNVLRGGSSDAATRIVSMNSAAALFISGGSESLRNGIDVAGESIRSGRAAGKLDQLAEMVKTR